jgi:hypothetical protein
MVQLDNELRDASATDMVQLHHNGSAIAGDVVQTHNDADPTEVKLAH